MSTPSSVTFRSLRGKPYRWTSPLTMAFRPKAASTLDQSISWAPAGIAEPRTVATRTGSIARMAGSFDGLMARIRPYAEIRRKENNAPRIFAVRCSRQTDPRTEAALARKLISLRGGRNILDADAAAVEQRDLIGRHPARPAADNQLPEVGVNIAIAHRAGADGVMQIAHHGAER